MILRKIWFKIPKSMVTRKSFLYGHKNVFKVFEIFKIQKTDLSKLAV